MYHNNAMTINKYVEAEQRTIFGAPYKRPVSVSKRLDITRES
jgi:hypothetical protein